MRSEYENGFIAGIAQEKETQMNLSKYNGWTNYATWRVNLEMFDGMQPEEYEWLRKWSACKDYAQDYICETSPEGLARDYALAFLNDVNWFEIASHYETEWLAANLQEFDTEE